MSENKESHKAPESMKREDFLSVAATLRKLSEDFEKIANELDASDSLDVYSIKTLNLGLNNCYIGLKRAQEALSDYRYGKEFGIGAEKKSKSSGKASKASRELKKVAEEKKNYSLKKSTRKKDAQ